MILEQSHARSCNHQQGECPSRRTSKHKSSEPRVRRPRFPAAGSGDLGSLRAGQGGGPQGSGREETACKGVAQS